MKYTDTFWRIFEYKVLVDYERAKKFVNEKQIPLPRFSNMYITSSCNQNCQYCEYKEENKKSVVMATDRVLKNIDQVYELGVRAIDFCGGGEPTLHRDLGKILKYCRQKGIVTGLFTNLAFRNQSLLEAIIENCSYIRISLDTYDEKKYMLIRRPRNENASFRQVMSNLRALVKLKKQKKKDIIIGTKMLITRFNHTEIEDFIKKSVKLKVDSVQFKKVSLYDELYISANAVSEMEKDFSIYKKKYGNKIDILQNFADLRLKVRCFMNINHIFIDAFGDVYLCCYYLRRKKRHKLGNIYNSRLRDIWFSDRHWRVAKNADIRECNRMDCRWIKFNNLMQDYIYEDRLCQLDFV